MSHSNCNYIQRKITPKSLDVHPIENALIIHCEAEVSVVNDDSNTETSSNCLVEKSKSFDKIIRLQSFNQDTDINILCRDVISQSEKLILPDQENEVKKLLSYLKSRKSVSTMIGPEIDNIYRPKTANSITHSNSTNFISKNQSSTNRLSYSASIQSISSNFQELIDYQTFFKQIENDFKESETIGKFYSNEKVSITQLNDYIDLLYEEMPKKLTGALSIFRLSLENENMLNLTTDESLLCALSRILREEGRKSNDLSSLILAFFCSISFFKEFHSVITKYKVGITSIELIGSLFEKETLFYQQLKTNDSQINKVEIFDENLKADLKSQDSNEPSMNVDQLMVNRKKFELFQRKNNRLLQLSFFFLLNLSSDVKTESKIFNKNIIAHLINSIKRSNLNLEMQLIIITFLQRLSVKWECKNQMISLGIVSTIYSLLNNIINQVSYYSILMNPLFKLIFNLTFDLKCRTQMIKQGYIHKLIQILIKSRFKNEKLLISIFYQFTLEKNYRNLFIVILSTGKNLMNLFINRTLQIGDKLNQNLVYEFLLDNDHCFTEYTCLMINLALDKDCSQVICENSALEKLLTKAFDENLNESNCTYINVCYMKILRNLSIHEHPYKMLFLEYHELLIRILLKEDSLNRSNDEDSIGNNYFEIFTIQALNILANLQKVVWLPLIKKYPLYEWIKKRIKIGSNFNNEIIIGCLAFLESCFSQVDCAYYLIETDCITLLIDLLNAKQEEDEMVMQILQIVYSMSNHEIVCNCLIKNDQIIVYLLDLLNDKNNQVRSICNFTLDLISEHDQDLKMKLKEERFKTFNKSWLEMINSNENLNLLNESDQKEESFEQFIQNDLFSEHLFSLENLNEEEMINDRFDLTTAKSRNRSSRPQTAKFRTKSAKLNSG